MKRIIDIVGALVVMGALVSCSNEATIKHASVEPDSLPNEPKIIEFKAGQEDTFGYYTNSSDTAFSKSVAWFVTYQGTKYRISKRMYQLISEYYNNNTRYYFECEVVDSDSLRGVRAESDIKSDCYVDENGVICCTNHSVCEYCY